MNQEQGQADEAENTNFSVSVTMIFKDMRTSNE